MTALHRDPQFWEGIELFDRGEYFASHDVWEALWAGDRGPSRRFLKGLIQIAVAFRHLRRGNAAGARKLARRGCRYLAPYRPRYGGIDVDRLIDHVNQCLDQALPDAAEREWQETEPALPTIPRAPAGSQ